jgi:glycosyltransferase involved in cell wall biosynthesis
LNRLILKDVAGAIVSGPSHLAVFDGVIDPHKVHIAANYASDSLFVSPDQIERKFAAAGPIRVLYISHMTEKKGYQRLLDGYLAASPQVQAAISMDFAGAFDTPENERAFRRRIEGIPGVHYHGVVTAETKIDLFSQAHVLGLPTSFLEGQPISILEAYAAGCVVVATGQPGILDIFTPGENGFVLEDGGPAEIADVLTRLCADRNVLVRTALRNRETADLRYRAPVSMNRVGAIVEGRAAKTTAARS